MKTERVTLLTTPEFKAFLVDEARREGVSVAELVRSRCEPRQSDEQVVLAALTAELRRAVADANRALRGGLDEAQAAIAEMRAARAAAPAAKPARRRPAAASAA